jgi:hypothetical protein
MATCGAKGALAVAASHQPMGARGFLIGLCGDHTVHVAGLITSAKSFPPSLTFDKSVLTSHFRQARY